MRFSWRKRDRIGDLERFVADLLRDKLRVGVFKLVGVCLAFPSSLMGVVDDDGCCDSFRSVIHFLLLRFNDVLFVPFLIGIFVARAVVCLPTTFRIDCRFVESSLMDAIFSDGCIDDVCFVGLLDDERITFDSALPLLGDFFLGVALSGVCLGDFVVDVVGVCLIFANGVCKR
jgi:hypothetical protein